MEAKAHAIVASTEKKEKVFLVPYTNIIPSTPKALPGGVEKKKVERVVSEFGDDMTDWVWQGPEDSDEEIEELIPFKN